MERTLDKLTDEELARYFYTKEAKRVLEYALRMMKWGATDDSISWEIRHAQKLLERVLD
jgi:hypothetical protein